MAEEMYQMRVSNDLHPIGLRIARKDDGTIELTLEYLLTGVDSRDETNELKPLTELFTRVHTVDDSIDSHPTNILQAIVLIGDYMETLAKEVEFN